MGGALGELAGCPWGCCPCTCPPCHCWLYPCACCMLGGCPCCAPMAPHCHACCLWPCTAGSGGSSSSSSCHGSVYRGRRLGRISVSMGRWKVLLLLRSPTSVVHGLYGAVLAAAAHVAAGVGVSATSRCSTGWLPPVLPPGSWHVSEGVVVVVGGCCWPWGVPLAPPCPVATGCCCRGPWLLLALPIRALRRQRLTSQCDTVGGCSSCSLCFPLGKSVATPLLLGPMWCHVDSPC